MILVESLIEFDIAQCNINVMYEKGLISERKYDELKELPKYERVVSIGLLMQKETFIRDNLKIFIKEYVSAFLKENNIDPVNVIEIASDAVWLSSVYPHKTKFGERINFVAKRKATCMMQIDKYCFYYNSLTGELFTRYLGSDSNEELTPFLTVIKEILDMYESRAEEKLYRYIHRMIREYALGNVAPSMRIDIVSKVPEKNLDYKDDSNFKFLLRVLKEIYIH